MRVKYPRIVISLLVLLGPTGLSGLSVRSAVGQGHVAGPATVSSGMVQDATERRRRPRSATRLGAQAGVSGQSGPTVRNPVGEGSGRGRGSVWWTESGKLLGTA